MADVFPATRVINGSASSRLIDLFKIVLTVGIVCRHAALVDVGDDYPLFYFFTKCLMGITEICVPLFYVLSGYLFFLNCPESPNVSYFVGKLRKRLFSLVIPYLIANVIAFGCYWFAEHYVPSLVSGFFGDKLHDPIFVFWSGPVNLSLWFVRELILCCLLSPLVWVLVRYTRIFGVLALGLLWAFHIGPLPIFLFSLGAWPVIRQLQSQRLSSWVERHPVNVAPSSRAWCFFVYLYHYLLIIGIKKALVLLCQPGSSLGYLACYGASVLLTLFLLTFGYQLLRRYVPKVASVLIGGK